MFPMLHHAGEATEEEQQQVDMRSLQREAVGTEGVCPRFHGQRRPQIRSDL